MMMVQMGFTSSSTSTFSTAFVLLFSSILPSFLLSLCCTSSAFLVTPVHAATKDQWRTRSIYQIITDRFARTDGSTTFPCDTGDRLYCGGTFKGIINHLDYIQGMGFTAIWISPVVEGISGVTNFGEGYHGFWTHDIMNINPHFGTADDLKQLSAEVHKRGMYIMVDVVINNVAFEGDGSDVVFEDLPPPFNDKKYFHPFRYIKDYNDQTQVQDWWLGNLNVSLPDLDTRLPYVQDVWHEWVKDLVANYSLDGLRIDAAKHINKDFWPGFQKAANVFTMGEVFNQPEDPPNSTCDWAVDALDSVLNFPAWYPMASILSNSSSPMGGLGYMTELIASQCYDSTLLGTFTENHDVKRFGNWTSDIAQQKNAMAATIMSEGIPVVYYGAEQRFSGESDPGNREALWLNEKGYDTNSTLYQAVRAMNIARTAVGDELAGVDYSNWSGFWAYKAKVLYARDDMLAFRKGYDTSIITALTNTGSDGGTIGPFHMGDTNLVQGATIVDVLSCTSMEVGLYGEFDITIHNGEPQVWVPARYLGKTVGLCTDLIKELNRTGATTEKAGDASSILPQSSTMYMATSLFLALWAFVL